jgi:hypothetical protein
MAKARQLPPGLAGSLKGDLILAAWDYADQYRASGSLDEREAIIAEICEHPRAHALTARIIGELGPHLG